MNKVRSSSAALLLLLMMGCEQEVDLALDAPPPRLIVEGCVEKILDETDYEQRIVLSTLNDFFDQSPTPRISDADVNVRDGQGNTYPYTADPAVPGRYTNGELRGEIGETYTLTIEWNNQTYEATETLVGVTPLEKVYSEFEEENAFEDGGFKLALDFTDPAGEENYYFWELFSGGENLIVPDPANSGNVVARDDFWDGQTVVGYFPSREIAFVVGNEVTVRHIGISAEYYRYLFLLFEQTGQIGQLVGVPPALIQGNIRNLTDPENIAMGYFGASEVDEETIMIVE